MIDRARGMGRASRSTVQTTVVTNCPQCGRVRLHIACVTVLVDEGVGTVSVTFACPACRRGTTNRIDRAGVAALRGAGAAFRLLTRPAEADEARHGPPLTGDDVDAFCAAMGDPAWHLLA